jgi:hypothetical protein
VTSADSDEEDNAWYTSPRVALDVTYRLLEASPGGPRDAAKHMYETLIAKVQAKHERLKKSGIVGVLAQAMQEFMWDVRVLLKLPDRAGVDFACILMECIAKSVHGDRDIVAGTGYDDHVESFLALDKMMCDAIEWRCCYTKSKGIIPWVPETLAMLQEEDKLLQSHGVLGYFQNSIQQLQLCSKGHQGV